MPSSPEFPERRQSSHRLPGCKTPCECTYLRRRHLLPCSSISPFTFQAVRIHSLQKLLDLIGFGLSLVALKIEDSAASVDKHSMTADLPIFLKSHGLHQPYQVVEADILPPGPDPLQKPLVLHLLNMIAPAI